MILSSIQLDVTHAHTSSVSWLRPGSRRHDQLVRRGGDQAGAHDDRGRDDRRRCSASAVMACTWFNTPRLTATSGPALSGVRGRLSCPVPPGAAAAVSHPTRDGDGDDRPASEGYLGDGQSQVVACLIRLS
jgi:hypothetical protein